MEATAADGKGGAGSGIRFSDPRVGNSLLIGAGLSFMLVCMLLPLVGPAAAHGSGSPGATTAPYYAKNFATFLTVALMTLGLSTAAVVSKLATRRETGGRLPFVSLALTGACVLILVCLFAGLFKI